MLQRLGDAYADVLGVHHRLIRASLAAHDGKEIGTQGDGFFAVFSSPSAGVAAAIEMQRAIGSYPWPDDEHVRVRMGIHSGEVAETAVGLVGLDVHRAARVAAVAHGGQIVLSATTSALVAYSLPAGASLRDLGLHRLKDLGRPEQIFQLGADGLAAEFPPLRSLDHPALLNNLPSSLSTFIGRESEIAHVRSLVEASRLVTLTGAGGSGKTRLALQVAADLLDGSGDGVWFVELAPLADAEQIPKAVAAALGIRDEPTWSSLESLLDALGRQNALLVLDNCEHVIDATAKLAHFVGRSCPSVHILATSREPLGIDGEHVHRVPSLDTPREGEDVDAVRNSEAVRLFTDRARQHGASIAWTRRPPRSSAASVDGWMASRWPSNWPPPVSGRCQWPSWTPGSTDASRSLTGGSRAALPRQQTLLAMVDWSWDLLHPAERQVLARLSVFAGGFDLAAAEDVTSGEGVPLDEVLGHLGALVDKSLVQFDDTGTGAVRYGLLETVRQYGTRQLEGHGSAGAEHVRVAHRDHYLALAEAAHPLLEAHGQAEWLDRLDLELDNLRVAIAFCLQQVDPVPGLRLVTTLRAFWKGRAHATEGVEALQALLDMPAPEDGDLLRARALVTEAHLLEQVGGYSTAERCTEEALAIARSTGDDRLVADILDVRSFLLLRRGQSAAALPLIESGLGLARRLEDAHLTARLLSGRSFAVSLEGDHDAATRDAAESVALYRTVGDQRQAGTMLANLGYAELSTDLDAARTHLVESLDIARVLNDRYAIVYGLFNLGLAEYLSGSSSAAESLFAESLALARRVAIKSSTAYAYIGLALTTTDRSDIARSARLHGAADAALAALGETVEPLEARLAESDRQRLRTVMGDEEFEREYTVGQGLAPEDASALALSG